MNKLDELIQELCPNGVEYKPVKEVYHRLRGTPITAAKMKEIESTDGDVRIFAGGKTVIDAYEEDIPNANITRVPAVLVQSRGVIDAVYYERPFTFKNEMWAYTHENKTAVKFLYYVLKNNMGKFREAASGMGSLPQISLKVTEDFEMPVPPLEVQREIVRILDNFTELTADLTADLTAELTARKKQYEYYRNKLLSFTWIPLGVIGEIRMCKRVLKEQTSDFAEIPFYKIGTFGKEPNAYISRELFNEYKSKYSYPRIGEILISASGTIGKAVIFDGQEAYFQDSNIVWVENDESQVLNKYLFYCYQIAKWKIAEGGTIQRLYNENLKKTLIPIPYPNDKEKSLEEQRRIVSILDKFDALITSISEGLPKEIELRRKQYEYYRNQLLSFPDNKAIA